MGDQTVALKRELDSSRFYEMGREGCASRVMGARDRGQDGAHPSGPAKGTEKAVKREGEGPYPKGLPSWPGRGKGFKGEGNGLEGEG